MSRKDDLKKLIILKNRRLQKLKEQQALFGPSTEPQILIEIEDLETELAALQKEAADLSKKVSQSRPATAGGITPIEALRQATKWVVGPAAKTLTGQEWKSLRQRLLTQASKLPAYAHLDTKLMDTAMDDLILLTHEGRILLEAHRIQPNRGDLNGIRQRAGHLADYLMRIYRLEAEDVPELAALAAEKH